MSGSGSFIAVVGPSGAGKDSLIGHARAALAGDDGFRFPTRIITRASDATEQCESVTPEAFARMAQDGSFALHWQANGLRYALPARVHTDLLDGRNVVANISRGTVMEARQLFPRAIVVLVTADAAVLKARLQSRGREIGADQISRLSRNVDAGLAVLPDVVIENNGALETAAAAFVGSLRHIARAGVEA